MQTTPSHAFAQKMYLPNQSPKAVALRDYLYYVFIFFVNRATFLTALAIMTLEGNYELTFKKCTTAAQHNVLVENFPQV